MSTSGAFSRAQALHRAGSLAAARPLYAALLPDPDAGPAARFALGLLELQDGRPDLAHELIAAVIAAAGPALRYRLALGHALAALGRWDDAAAEYAAVLAEDPARADAHYALGAVRQARTDYAGAAAAYAAAAAHDPTSADALVGLGNCRQLLGERRAAEAAYREALRLRPDDPATLSNLGALLDGDGRAGEALALLEAAVGRAPLVAPYVINLGVALSRRGRHAEARDVLRHAVACDADNAEAAYNLGIALQGLGELAEAALEYRRAAALRPTHAAALNNLGNVLGEQGDAAGAEAAYQAALRAEPASVVACNNLGCLYRSLGRLDEAEDALRRGLEFDAAQAALHDNLGSVLKDAGELGAALECYRRALALDPAAVASHANLAYALSFEDADGEATRAELRRFGARFAPPPPVAWPAVAGGGRLRIGYLSADFRDHCQTLFTLPLLAHHDRAAFEIVCYSGVPRPDDHTRRLAGHADRWREVRHLDDATLARTIRDDGIDVLVDLTMHMANGRPAVFAAKPAPAQIAWLAYPGSTGLAAIDYRLSDAWLDPPGEDPGTAERTLRLPDSFWCYDPLIDRPTAGPPPALRLGHVTFGCLNNPCKLSQATLALWAQVFARLPTARLRLMAPTGRHRARLAWRLAALGVAAGRVEFVPYRPRAEYLAGYEAIDLCLDTVPYNGHTTSLDALWMGVPVVTRVGRTPVGRGGLSQLAQLGLSELAAASDEAFVATAVALATDLPRLAALRAGLRARLEASPLMDAPRFARAIEAAYRFARESVAAPVTTSARTA
ncbi:MAG: tetratricopeptide repeat protein [Proteobacteria bacterium]|nr:tetratricopeptide repeat protein [Pseudomonadota bacterium]